MVTVGISDLAVVGADDTLVTYALGSCVGICLYDNVNKIAGLAHIMLPASAASTVNGSEMRFADTAIPMLIKKMSIAGAKTIYLKAKIAGGAQMFVVDKNSLISNIGGRNVAAVKDVLQKLRIQIIAEDTGKNYGRTLYFNGLNGAVRIKSVKHGESTL
ncbi:MAG: chemotaxis protein CheD [Oscillospiraceae bacterium]